MSDFGKSVVAWPRTEASFRSSGDLLRGWFYMPEPADEDLPCIVLSHGFSAVKEQYLDRYCALFAANGFATLAFDHPCFGDSEGLPRHEVDPARQIAGLHDAIDFVRTLPAIDSERVGLWGSSYSGGHALCVAARDDRLAAVVAQVPTISGSRAAARRRSVVPPNELEARFDADMAGRRAGAPAEMVDVTSGRAADFCALPGDDAHAFFEQSRSFAPNWRNRVTLQSMAMARRYEPAAEIEKIAPCPLLLIAMEDDSLTPADLAREAFDRLDGVKQFHLLPGNHFDPYTRLFDVTSDLALRWFRQHLQGDGADATCRASG